MSTTASATGVTSRDGAHTLFAQTMQYVATTGLSALFVAGFGAAGYATRRDLTAIARVASWALIGLIVFGIVLIFVQIPGDALIYSIVGLLIFAALTAFDFQRLRQSTDLASAPLMAASIFLDILNVFLLFLQLFTRTDES
jgi:modulator of FtsH protease